MCDQDPTTKSSQLWVRSHVVGPAQTPERGVVVGTTGRKRADPDLPREGEVVAGLRIGNGGTTVAGDRAVGTSVMALHRVDVVFSTGIAPDPRATLEATGGEDQSASRTSPEVVHQGNFFYICIIFLFYYIIYYCLYHIHVITTREFLSNFIMLFCS